MTPNPKHVEILANVTRYSTNRIDGQPQLHISVKEALTAMQVLQDQIDDLKAQNKELRDRLKEYE